MTESPPDLGPKIEGGFGDLVTHCGLVEGVEQGHGARPLAHGYPCPRMRTVSRHGIEVGGQGLGAQPPVVGSRGFGEVGVLEQGLGAQPAVRRRTGSGEEV